MFVSGCESDSVSMNLIWLWICSRYLNSLFKLRWQKESTSPKIQDIRLHRTYEKFLKCCSVFSRHFSSLRQTFPLFQKRKRVSVSYPTISFYTSFKSSMTLSEAEGLICEPTYSPHLTLQSVFKKQSASHLLREVRICCQ